MDLRPLGLLSRISNEMLDDGPLSERADRLVKEIVRYFRVDSCIIRTLEPDGNLKLLAAVGVEGMTIAPVIPAFYGISRGILEDRQPVVIEDAATHPLTALLYAKGKNVAGRFFFESYAGAPMLGGDGPVGLIGIYSCRERRHFDEQTVQFLQVVANHFGVMIVNTLLKESLEQRVAVRTSELAKARDEANAASRAKSDFLACMSHELQTPLNSIVGFGQLLEESPLDPRQRESVTCILQSSRLLVDIIKDILDFSNIETGRLAIQSIPFSPQENLLRTFELMKQAASDKALEYELVFDPNIPKKLLGDPVRICQIVLHLLSNAVKFTDQGRVRLSVRYGLPIGATGPALVIEVEDTGVGLPEGMHPGTLKPFSQGDQSTARSYGGVGLGLSLVDRLVKAMGGKLDVLAVPQRGTRMMLTIPLAEAPGREAAKRIKSAPPDSSQTRVLIVEDNETNRLVLRRMLERIGILAIAVAEGGQAALDLLGEARFDLVLMDVHMPGMDGVECTRIIRARDWWAREIPIVAVTAGTKREDVEACLEAGMNAVIAKPIETERLKEAFAMYGINSSTQIMSRTKV